MLAVIGAILKTLICARAGPTPVPTPPPVPLLLRADAGRPTPVAIAQQKAKLEAQRRPHGDFPVRRAPAARSACTAAVGLDQVLGYDLVPARRSAAAGPPCRRRLRQSAAPTPSPRRPRRRPPTPSNLRVLFLYDPLTLIDMPPEKQAILAVAGVAIVPRQALPAGKRLRGGMCPLTAGKTPSYRFLPINADVSRLSPVWQQTYRCGGGEDRRPGYWPPTRPGRR